MNTILKIIAYILIIPLLLIWLLFCAFLALFGILFTKKEIIIDLEKVKRKETICKVLNKKGLISNEQYSFETNEVAILYDETTFRGYLFILKPVIVLLKYTNFLDTFMSYLAHKWMAVHSFKIKYKSEAKTFFSLLCRISVYIAKLVGTFLYLFKR